MIYFTSDLHLNHKVVTQLRGLQFHDSTLIDNINQKVGKHDSLFHLGDFCPKGSEEEILKYISQINCENLYFIRGNHDKKLKRLFKDSFFTDTKKYISFDEVFDYSFSQNGENYRIFLSHYCHYIWPGSHKGSMMLYGHTHSHEEEDLDKLFPNRKSMDVGVDNYHRLFGSYQPFSFDEVLEIMNKNKGNKC